MKIVTSQFVTSENINMKMRHVTKAGQNQNSEQKNIKIKNEFLLTVKYKCCNEKAGQHFISAMEEKLPNVQSME